ncbi:MAG: metal-dependent hydrolase [Deltaproteobacteria bacterium]|nr:metal-dependent hydrolase [Deltaproteobacteria bacterium]
MPTVVGHALFASALGAGFRARPALIACAAFCAVAPDFDVLAFRFGIPYEAPLGHRGFSHSLLFAALLGLAATLLLRAFLRGAARPGFAPTFALLTLAAASHGFFDALTDGGLGVAFFSPFDHTRYFLPWRPIAVSPLGIARFFSDRGAAVIASEAAWIGAPSLLLWLALRWRAARPAQP